MTIAPFSCSEEQTLLLSGRRPFKGSQSQTKAQRVFCYKIKSYQNPILLQDCHFEYQFKVLAAPFSCTEEQTLLLSGRRPFKGSQSQSKAQRAFHNKIKSYQNPILLQDSHFEYQFKVLADPFSCIEEQTLLLSGQRPFEGSRSQTEARRAFHYKIKSS